MSGRAKVAPELQRLLENRTIFGNCGHAGERELRALLAVAKGAQLLQRSVMNEPDWHSAQGAISRALARLERATR